jgi:tRNA(Ile)-lysidine synthase TilS/MesJ
MIPRFPEPETPFLCSSCVLPETFPGIRFDENGVCNYCQREKPALTVLGQKKASYRSQLDHLLLDAHHPGSAYDFIAAYSGGKDSTFVLKLLKERYGARILALTFDNHFVSPQAWANIRNVTDRLGIDHLSVRPNWPLMKTLFRTAALQDLFPSSSLLRASSICTACIGLVKIVILKAALERSIPFLAYGWSPGQAPLQSSIMKNNPEFVRQNQRIFKKAVPAEIAAQMEAWFVPEEYYERYKENFPLNIHPLAFFDYDEGAIKAEIEGLGWVPPRDTDENSTNCLLNALANDCHINRHHYHPYAQEIANMVRQGVMSREEGIDKIYSDQDPTQIVYARRKLGL